MIIDGYNVIHAWRLDTANLENARHELLHILDDYAGFSGEQITVVFDAYNKKTAGVEEKQGQITVIYTEHGMTADTYIQRAVKQSARRLKVVTADYLEQLSVFEAGAIRITPSELKLYIDAARNKHAGLLHRSSLSGDALKARLKLDSILDQD
jgi:predicted RNA-binding protein with PIN domain